jgi:hypothetical protein
MRAHTRCLSLETTGDSAHPLPDLPTTVSHFVMNSSSSRFRTAILVASFGFAFGTTAACATEEAIDGRVDHVQGERVHLCFDGSHAPSSGERVQLIRHVLRSSPKGAETMTSSIVGSAEVDAVDGARCAGAHVVDGDAHALDWVSTAGP